VSDYSNSTFSWGIDVTCNVCGTSWTICKTCTAQHKHLIGKRAAYHHDRNKHQKKQRVWEDNCATQDNNYDIVHDNNNNVSQSTSALNLNDYALPGYPEIKMVGEINQKYFQTELRTGLARSFLVGQSQFKLDNIITELSPEEVDMHHSIAALVSSSTTGQQHMLAKVLSDVAAVLIKQLSNVDKKMDNKAAIDLYYG
jgi:hypothetical protein